MCFCLWAIPTALPKIISSEWVAGMSNEHHVDLTTVGIKFMYASRYQSKRR